MLPWAIAALLGLAQLTATQDQCTEGEANVHIPGADMRAQVVLQGGELTRQYGMFSMDGDPGPFWILIGYPEPGAKPDWVQVFYYSTNDPIRPNEKLRLTAPDGQHWDLTPRAMGLTSRSGRKGTAADFLFLSQGTPNAELARQIAGSEAFNIEHFRDGAVHAAMRFHPLPRDLRTILHQKAIDQARAAAKPCGPVTIPPQSAP